MAFKMRGNPFKQKTRKESSGHEWVDNPTKEHTMDKYEDIT